MKIEMETKRLYLRKLCTDDFASLQPIFQDAATMYAWEHTFTDAALNDWLQKNLVRYENDGYSYFAAIQKSTDKLIGVMGPLVETVEGARRVGIAYILHKDYWKKGYAREGASASLNYIFCQLGEEESVALIRPNNAASRQVAEHLGMTVEGEFVRQYRGKDMPHLIYVKKNPYR